MRDHAKSGALTEVTFFVLLSLAKPRHGYSIMQFIQEHTAGSLTLGAGTLYGALTSLTEKGWITPCGEVTDRRKLYRLTPLGQVIVTDELERLEAVARTARTILGGMDHD